MNQHAKLRLIELDILEFTKEGHGLGYFEPVENKRLTIEVPFAIPGDRVEALLKGKHKGVHDGVLEKIIKPSPQRITPRCIHFAKCGGCRWQQISYEQQLKQKEQWIHQIFAPYLHTDVKVYPIIPCIPPWQYRNKMEFSFSTDRLSNRYLGLILLGSKGKVFKMEECHLVHPWFVEAVKATYTWWEESGLDAYHVGQNTGSLRTLIVREGRHSGDRLAMLTVSGNPEFALNRKQLDRFVAILRQAIEPINPDQKLSLFLRIQQIAKGRPTNFFEMLLYGPDHIREILHLEDTKNKPYSLMFRISPSAFFQPNTQQAEILYSRALQMIQIPEDSIVYDLYCGTGTLGICAAKQAKEVISVELSPEAVVDARENIKLNGLSNIKIIQGDVGQSLKRLVDEGYPHPNVVMVDPPRSGLDSKAIEYLLQIKASTLLYISCNPLTQASNIEGLIKGGYRLIAIQPVDQFPQTVHVENIAVLRIDLLHN